MSVKPHTHNGTAKLRDYATHPLTQKELDDIRHQSDAFYRRMNERDNAWRHHPDNRTARILVFVVCLVEAAIGLICWLCR